MSEETSVATVNRRLSVDHGRDGRWLPHCECGHLKVRHRASSGSYVDGRAECEEPGCECGGYRLESPRKPRAQVGYVTTPEHQARLTFLNTYLAWMSCPESERAEREAEFHRAAAAFALECLPKSQTAATTKGDPA